mmetsp:Transcript_46615/g.117398  ORF Transcript_46615/g.117398 Transcript_46615/m.117398 type:complete len:138 (-) Transcript_46615:813-1226(-)
MDHDELRRLTAHVLEHLQTPPEHWTPDKRLQVSCLLEHLSASLEVVQILHHHQQEAIAYKEKNLSDLLSQLNTRKRSVFEHCQAHPTLRSCNPTLSSGNASLEGLLNSLPKSSTTDDMKIHLSKALLHYNQQKANPK